MANLFIMGNYFNELNCNLEFKKSTHSIVNKILKIFCKVYDTDSLV